MESATVRAAPGGRYYAIGVERARGTRSHARSSPTAQPERLIFGLVVRGATATTMREVEDLIVINVDDLERLRGVVAQPSHDTSLMSRYPPIRVTWRAMD